MTKPIRRSNAPDPEKYAQSGSEAAAQIALFMWSAAPDVRERYPELVWLFHIPNGGSRHKAEAGKLRAMGVKPGVLDIFLPVKRGQFPGLWIELKKLKENGVLPRVTPEQKVWADHLARQGYAVKVCYGWQDARETLVSYLEWNGK